MSTGSTVAVPLTGEDRVRLGRRARRLAKVSVAFTTVEAVVSVAAGKVASSIALVGFGLDSVVETASGLVIVWQFGHPTPESREWRALRLIGVSLLALAAYVAIESVRGLMSGQVADSSPVGIGMAAVSVVVMPLLAWAKRRTGRALGSASVVADSTQSWLCTYLSAVLLGGLLMNAALGWWWADPLVGLVIAGIAAREGLTAWRGEACAPSPILPGEGAGGEEAGGDSPDADRRSDEDLSEEENDAAGGRT
ncbi:MAG: cation transporter [Candidatus Nanopelagicales bacterium]